MTIEKAYTDYNKMIKMMAHRYSKKYCTEYEELEAEGNLTFCIAYQKYNSSKGCFSTYLYHCLENKMKDFCKNIMIRQFRESCSDAMESFSYIPKELEYELPADQQTVLDTALDLIPSGQVYQKYIKQELKNKGWTPKQIISAFQGIQKTLEAI